MKKLLFLSAFFIAGLVGAKENVEKRTDSEEKAKTELKNDHAAIESEETSQVSTAKACSQWVGVTAPCGASYSLCTDNYQTWGDLVEAAEYFNDVKC